VDEMRAGKNPLADGGIVALLAGDEQRAVLQKIQGMMSLLEGHGDITMDRAATDRVPNADRFSRVLRERRSNTRGPGRILQQIIGLEAKLKQYEQGEAFIRTVEEAGGRELLNRVWTGPEALPTLDEIREPEQWLERMTTTGVASR
jgi:putative hydrolase